MSKLRHNFSHKEWKDCCTKFCKDCKIAQAYKEKFGKKEGQHKLKKDQRKVLD